MEPLVLCPSCSSAYLDPYGRCHGCGYTAAPPVGFGSVQAAGLYPVTYGTPTAPTGLAIATQLMLGAQVLAGLIGVVGGVLKLSSLSADGTTGSAALAVTGLASLISVLSFIAGVVLFIIWFHKSRVLADILGPNLRKSFSRGFAVGGWFIPVGFCWIPRGVAGDIWAASRPLDPSSKANPRKSGLLNAWWTCWCLYWAIAIVASIVTTSARMNGDVLSLSYLRTSSGLGIGIDVVRIAAAVLAVLVIRQITTMQRVRILQGPGADHPYAMQPTPMPYPQPYPQAAYAPQPAYAPQQYQPQAAQPVQDAQVAGAQPVDGGVSPLTGPVTLGKTPVPDAAKDAASDTAPAAAADPAAGSADEGTVG